MSTPAWTAVAADMDDRIREWRRLDQGLTWMAAWVSQLTTSAGGWRPRTILTAPRLTVSLRRRWRPWGGTVRKRDGTVMVLFGVLLLSVMVTVREGW